MMNAGFRLGIGCLIAETNHILVILCLEVHDEEYMIIVYPNVTNLCSKY